MTRHDISGDGRADTIVTSPWGIGVLSLQGSAMVQSAIAANGTRLGEWLLNTSENSVELRADLDGDRVGELLMSSPWGIGVLKLVGGQLRSIAMAQNGHRVGGWIIDTSNNQFLHAADLDGDGREEVLVTSPWGLGLLKLSGTLTTLMLAPNGTRFGGWLLNTDDNSFPLLADVDGDGRAEIIVTSPWGLGVLKFDGTGLTSIVMAPNGTSFGDWTLNTATDSIEAAADVNGDGRSELIVRGPNGIAALRFDAGALHTVATALNGSNLGGWTFDTASDRFGVAGDLVGDGCAEILTSGNQGLALLAVQGGHFTLRMKAPNGTRFGGWLLNTRDNRINHVADFDGDGRAEILISSPWGMGILKLSGTTLTAVTMSPNGTRFGGWLLNTADNDLEAGLGQSYALLIWHPQWTGAINSTRDFLRRRGYTVVDTQDVHVGLTRLRRLSLITRASDRVFVYLAGHGATYRTLADTAQSTSATHILQFGDGAVVGYDQFTPSFRRIGATGADLTVFDGSCDGGEAVMDAIGQRYLALSTTAIHSPGLTNTPNPGDVMGRVGRPNSFGMWWSPEKTASLMTSQAPHRFYQKIFRSDDTGINRWSLFYKPAITYFQAVGGNWELMVRHCYLYRYVYPDGYAKLTQAEKDATTGSANTYLTSMRADRTALAPSIAALRSFLGDATLTGHAADIYAAAYPAPWRTMFGDMAWNVDTHPVRKSPIGTAIEPRRYAGRSGFLQMVAGILRTLTLFEQSCDKQEQLLRQLDAELHARRIFKGVIHDRVIERVLPKPTDYLRFNEADEWNRARQLRFFETMKEPQSRIANKIDLLRSDPAASDYSSLFASELAELAGPAVGAKAPPTVDVIVAQITMMQAVDAVLLDQLFYMLTIVEEAVSRASAKGAEVGDLVSF